ncbi:Fic family protein [Patescibacteria group bacterium]|nr:Fic family protein [Patescibacteria group bacterium]
MAKINKRQQEILNFIRLNPDTTNSAILQYLTKNFEDVSRITIVRDLNLLLKEKLINKIGQGRNVSYSEAITNKLLRFFDVEQYFKMGPDERKVAYKNFNFDIFNNLENIFTDQELKSLTILNDEYLFNVEKLSQSSLKKEFERLTIELSWKSSQIEGNTYSLIDTEILIKENKEAPGHKKEEATMILNHKKVLDYILVNQSKFKILKLRDIEDVHQLIVKGLGVETGLRKRAVGITGTSYKPLDNRHKIKESLEEAIKSLNKISDPFSKSFLAILFISYIQPFEDGNKRTARMIANAVLLSHNACPLSFRSIDEADYKKGVILFYEQNSARFFKKLFFEQFEFSVKNYFLT